MASTQRTASGKWTCRVYIGLKDGKRKYKRFTADTKKEAERSACHYLVEHPIKEDQKEKTLREAMEAYISSKDGVLSASTIAGYDIILRMRFKSIMDQNIYDLTTEEIQKAVNEESKKYSRKTVENAVGLLSATLSMFKVTMPEITLAQQEKKEIVIPTDEELKIICEKSFEKKIAFYVHLSSYMGLRRSELAAIDIKKDYNEKAKTIRIKKAIVADKNHKYVEKTTKSESSTRIVPVPSICIPAIEQEIELNRPPLTPGAIEARFIKMKKTIGMDHITLHSLRHYFASTLVVMNVPDIYAMKLMGHKTDDMLKKVYQHIKKDYLDEVTEKMENYYMKKQIDD